MEYQNIKLDTLIGYRDWFYGMDKQEDFKIFENKMNKIKVDGINNLVLAVDSSNLYLNVVDVEINIEKLTEEEMLASADLNGEGKYLYNITNDIYLPFEKSELVEYLSNSKRVIKVSLSLEYGFNESNIGVGIRVINESKDSL
jgi:hypothetical protein